MTSPKNGSKSTVPHSEASNPADRRRVGVYELAHQLGRGGMGEVWLARRADGEFEHTVAIKLLDAQVDSDAARERLRRERQMLARLNHPHIARLLDGGTLEDGRPYFVMERVEGERIDTWCARRQVPLADRLRLVLKLSEAVAAAHRQGMVHRDLKPGNVLVTSDGAVKLVDFGIAKRMRSEQTDLTLTGQRPMTPGYASPEQVRGEKVTAATDIYGLGALTYELVTGRRPFDLAGMPTYAVEQAVCERRVRLPSRAVAESRPRHVSVPGVGKMSLAPPEPEGELRRTLHNGLDRILHRALNKDPEQRQGSVEEFAQELQGALTGLSHPKVSKRQRWHVPPLPRFLERALPAAALLTLILGLQGFSDHAPLTPSEVSPTWAARLPEMEEILNSTGLVSGPRLLFVPFLSDSSQDHSTVFLVSKALGWSLSSRRDLQMIGERSAWEVRRGHLENNSHAMAAAVDADFVLRGRTQGEGSMRLHVQLDWAVDGRTLWSENYELGEVDVSQALDDIEANTARVLGLRAPTPGKTAQHLIGWEEEKDDWPSPATVDFGRAFYLWSLERGPSAELSALVRGVIDQKPTMAPAWTLLAVVDIDKLDPAVTLEARAQHEDRLRRSLELDPDFFLAHYHYADSRLMDYDMAAAGKALRQVLRDKPMFTPALHQASWLASTSADLEAAVVLAERAAVLDPLDPIDLLNYAHMLYLSGRYDKALRQLEVSRVVDPQKTGIEVLRSMILLAQGAPEAAREAAELELIEGFRDLGIALSEHALGNQEASDAALSQLIENHGRPFAFQIAQAYACRDGRELALHWLRIGAEVRDPGLTYVRRDPCFSTWRDDPRLRGLVDELLPLPQGSKPLGFPPLATRG